jgi:hypothetical protein
VAIAVIVDGAVAKLCGQWLDVVETETAPSAVDALLPPELAAPHVAATRALERLVVPEGKSPPALVYVAVARVVHAVAPLVAARVTVWIVIGAVPCQRGCGSLPGLFAAQVR